MMRGVAEFVQIGAQTSSSVRPAVCAPPARSRTIIWLQVVTLAWMLIECGVSIYAAKTARSPALLAFGSDSFVELLSATIVLMQWTPAISISDRKAHRTSAVLLFALAAIVATTAILSLLLHLRPETSRIGMAITLAALIAMPILAVLKRREARLHRNAALAADAVQSATCAYLALTTLVGLAINAMFHAPWVDSFAALVAVPFLLKEGRSAWQGHACGCC